MTMLREWGEAQDNALKEFWPRHGSQWDGWDEVLPTRSTGEIAKRAAELGLVADGEKAPTIKRKAKTTLVPDPYEGYVLRCMHQGMTPTEIDRSKRWLPGTARLIMSNRWLREKERFS